MNLLDTHADIHIFVIRGMPVPVRRKGLRRRNLGRSERTPYFLVYCSGQAHGKRGLFGGMARDKKTYVGLVVCWSLCVTNQRER